MNKSYRQSIKKFLSNINLYCIPIFFFFIRIIKIVSYFFFLIYINVYIMFVILNKNTYLKTIYKYILLLHLEFKMSFINQPVNWSASPLSLKYNYFTTYVH